MSDSSDKLNDPIDQLDLEKRYSDWQSLGQGGMGKVFAAHDEMLDKKVAIKLLHGDVDSRAVVRFQQEAKVLSKLNHEFIVRINDFHYSKSGELFLVMEYVDGSSLESVLNKSGRLSPEEALRIAIQLSKALKYAHKQGIIHRDLKPANVMLDSKRDVKILDFGIAKLVSASEIFGTLTKAGQLIGSPLYMSPEQLRGEAACELSDVYGLGLLLCTMITGQPPFAGDNLMESLQQRLTTSAPSLQPYVENPKLCKGLDSLAAHALNPDPDQRLASMSEFEEALLALQATTAQSIDVTEVNPLIVAKRGRTKLVVGGILLLSLLLVAVAIATRTQTRQTIVKVSSDYKAEILPQNAEELVLKKTKVYKPNKKLNRLVKERPEPVGEFTRASLRSFWLAPDPLTEDALKRLPSSVRRLSFEGSQSLTGQTLTKLPVAQLDGLDLRKTAITDEDMKQVAKLTGLIWLDLSHTKITERGIAYLAPLQGLFRLGLNGCTRINDSIIPDLRKLRVLRNLEASNTGLTSDGVIKLRTIRTLKKVSFGGLNIIDDDIIGFRDLSYVNLAGCRNITNKTLRHFATQPSLVYLDVTGCPKITKPGIEAFLATHQPELRHFIYTRAVNDPAVDFYAGENSEDDF